MRDYREAYSRADSICKDVQSYTLTASVPAINELRYAGYHLLKSLSDDGAVTDNEQLRKAKNHVSRAAYEATEGGVVHCLSVIGSFKEDYAKIHVAPSLPEYAVILAAANEAQERIGLPRPADEHQEMDYEGLWASFRQLKPYCRLVDAARDVLNARIAEDRERADQERRREEQRLSEERAKARRDVWLMIFAAATLVVTIAGAIFAFTGPLAHHDEKPIVAPSSTVPPPASNTVVTDTGS